MAGEKSITLGLCAIPGCDWWRCRGIDRRRGGAVPVFPITKPIDRAKALGGRCQGILQTRNKEANRQNFYGKFQAHRFGAKLFMCVYFSNQEPNQSTMPLGWHRLGIHQEGPPAKQGVQVVLNMECGREVNFLLKFSGMMRTSGERQVDPKSIGFWRQLVL